MQCKNQAQPNLAALANDSELDKDAAIRLLLERVALLESHLAHETGYSVQKAIEERENERRGDRTAF